MRQYQNYIFDLYGTLVDIRTDENNKTLWKRMSLFFGYQGALYEEKELQQAYLQQVASLEQERKQQDAVHYEHESYPEIPIEEVFATLYQAKGVEPEERLLLHTGQMFRALSTEFVKTYAHARELLLALKQAGRGVYLLSNAQRVFTEYELYYLGIHDCFDGILISSEEGCKKPDEHFFRLLQERYHLAVEDCLMIGNDMATDIAGACKIGMDSFYIHSAISPKRITSSAGNKSEDQATYRMEHMNLKTLQKKLLG